MSSDQKKPLPACQCGQPGCCGHWEQQEIERLREALRNLVAWSDQNEPIHEAMRAAKEALNEQ